MSISYIGTCLYIAVGSPATEDETGYDALTWVEVGKIVSIGELGDESEDIAFDLLKPGRRTHVSGVKDLGEIPVTIEYDREDAGQDIVRTANNTNVTHSFRIDDPDGDEIFFQGLVANIKFLERVANQYKGFNMVIRGQTGTTTVEGS